MYHIPSESILISSLFSELQHLKIPAKSHRLRKLSISYIGHMTFLSQFAIYGAFNLLLHPFVKLEIAVTPKSVIIAN